MTRVVELRVDVPIHISAGDEKIEAKAKLSSISKANPEVSFKPCAAANCSSTDVWAADYGCLLVYEGPDCSGEFRRFENLDQVEDFLVQREKSGT